jgi:Zn-dependent protease
VTFVLVMVLWVFSVVLHEFGHALAAYYGGDTSVKDKGYLSLDPLRYVDPTNSILLPLLFLALGGIGLPGGAVYIDYSRLRTKIWEMVVPLAGPFANLLIAIVLALALNLDDGTSNAGPALAFLAWLQISAVLLNLLPFPPFDGYHVIAPMLSYDMRRQMDIIAPYGLWVVLALFWFVPAFSSTFWNIVASITHLLGVPSSEIWQGYQDFFFWKR